MLNRTDLVGIIGKDGVLLRYTPNGRPVASLKLGIKRPFKTNGEYEWDNLPVVVWGPSAEYAANNGNAGDYAVVSGRSQARSYEDNDGKKRWVTEVIADSFSLIKPKVSGAESADSMGETVEFNDDDNPF